MIWTYLSRLLIEIVIAIISDKVVVEASKKLIGKAVDSAVDGVGITDSDAKYLIHSIANSGLNTLTKDVVSRVIK